MNDLYFATPQRELKFKGSLAPQAKICAKARCNSWKPHKHQKCSIVRAPKTRFLWGYAPALLNTTQSNIFANLIPRDNREKHCIWYSEYGNNVPRPRPLQNETKTRFFITKGQRKVSYKSCLDRKYEPIQNLPHDYWSFGRKKGLLLSQCTK